MFVFVCYYFWTRPWIVNDREWCKFYLLVQTRWRVYRIPFLIWFRVENRELCYCHSHLPESLCLVTSLVIIEWLLLRYVFSLWLNLDRYLDAKWVSFSMLVVFHSGGSEGAVRNGVNSLPRLFKKRDLISVLSLCMLLYSRSWMLRWNLAEKTSMDMVVGRM